MTIVENRDWQLDGSIGGVGDQANMLGANRRPENAGATMGDQASTVPARLPTAAREMMIPALAATAACLATLVVASTAKRRSPWAGLNALAAGMGLGNRWRPSGRFHGGTAAAIGMVVGGGIALAAMERAIARATGGTIVPAIATAIGGAAADRVLLRRGVFRALTRTIGVEGTIAKYAVMGLASALAARRSGV